MAFDHFQRYKTIQIIVAELKKRIGKRQVSILEIGGNGQCNLDEMFPGETIQYSNLTVPIDRVEDERFMVLDGTNMPQIESDAYDIVVGLDVFEHIEEKKRSSFLKETYRVAKYMTILCFPFANGKNENTEKRVNNYYKAIYGKDHVWLKEHIENGLPDIACVEGILKEEEIFYQIFEHGDTIIWEEWMKALISTYDIAGASPYLESLEEYYAQNIYPYDFGIYNYRAFLMLSKQEKLVQEMEHIMVPTFTEENKQEKKILIRGLDDLKNLCRRKVCIKTQSSLYVDFGDGYSEKSRIMRETIAAEGSQTIISCRYELPDHVKGLRFDPVEGCGCIVSEIKVESNEGFLQVIPVGGRKQGENYVFLGNDPQFQLYIDEKNISWVEILAVMNIYTERKDGILLKSVEEMITENEKVMMGRMKEALEISANSTKRACEAENREKEEKKVAEEMKNRCDQLEFEKREMIVQLQNIQKEKVDLNVRWEKEKEKAEFYEWAYNKVTHSKSWKITSPLRKLFGQERKKEESGNL